MSASVQVTRFTGHSIHHIDLLLLRAHLRLLCGDAEGAEADARTALFGQVPDPDRLIYDTDPLDESSRPERRGIFPPAPSGLPELLAATHPECGYAWGEGEGRHRWAQALLLRAAQRLGRTRFAPADEAGLPEDVRGWVGNANVQLQKALGLRRRIWDPGANDTQALLARLSGGWLWHDVSPRTPAAVPPQAGATDTVAMNTAPPPDRVEVFYCYSHADEALRKKLEAHLAAMKRQGEIDDWHDRRIVPGADWQEQLDQHLESAAVILLLVSSDFLASDYCYHREMTRALERHKEGSARVIPVILRPVDWQATPFAGLQVLPKDGKPVTKWGNRDDAFMDIASGIRQAVEQIKRRRSLRGPSVTHSAKPPVSSLNPPGPPIRPRAARVRVVVDIDYSTVSEAQLRLLQYGVAGFLEVDPSRVRVLEVQPGSVKVTLEVPDALAAVLLEAIADRNPNLEAWVKPLRILSAQLLVGGADGASADHQGLRQPIRSHAIKTVLELDLVGYSSEARRLEQGLGTAEVVLRLNDQIQGFVDEGLRAVGLPREKAVMATTGDGAILLFDAAADAHRFAEALHAAADRHNAGVSEPTAKRWFRTGAATGEVATRARPGGGTDVAGTTIANAVRLEAAGTPGQLLVDAATFDALPHEMKLRYGGPEQVPGKRDETFAVRRCVFVAHAGADAKTAAPPAAHQGGSAPQAQQPAADPLAVIRLLETLSTEDQLIFLMVLISMPLERQPAAALNMATRRAQVLTWATAPGGCGLPALSDALRAILPDGGGGNSQ